MDKEQERVDAASEEACKLALDAIFDSHLQLALMRRAKREREEREPWTVQKA